MRDGKVVRNTSVFIHVPIPMYLELIMIQLQAHDEISHEEDSPCLVCFFPIQAIRWE